MSNVENDPDQVYEIDQDTFDQITEIVHKVKTRYTTWYDFVDDAVRTIATWWNSPPDAEKIFTQVLWPHMTSEQHNIMKDPKLGGIKTYENLKKLAEEYHKKNKLSLDPPDLEVDTEVEKDALETLKETDYLQYTIKARRVYDIKQILKTAKSVSGDSYYQSSHDFMKQTIHLFINYWNNPYGNVNEMCEMFPFLTKKQCRHWYDLDPRKDGGYMTFKKVAEDYHIKSGRKMNMEDGIEQLVEQMKNIGQHKEANLRKDDELVKKYQEMVSEVDDPFHKRNLDLNKKQIKEFYDKDRFKEPGDAIKPEKQNKDSVIYAFYSRFFPTKLILTVLADMICKNNGTPVVYSYFREEVYRRAIIVSEHLKNFEHKWENEKDGTIGLPRNKKISTGLPLPINKDEKDIKKIIKSEASKERFLEYFVGVSIKQWNRKQYDQKKFDGALNSMGLVHITNTDDGLKITLSNIGAEFSDIHNEILYNFSNMTKLLKPVNDEESVFIMDEIISKFDQEKTYADCIKKELVKHDWVFGRELDKVCFDKADEGKRRQAIMGRLAEMDLVDWRIGSKKWKDDEADWGKSCFKLNEPLKNIW